MRFASFAASVTAIVSCTASVATAQGAAVKPRSGWYIGGGIGGGGAANIAQSGWNRDPICYPTNACFDEDPRPEISGYRWQYDIAAAAGPGLEFLTGLMVRRTRLELSFGQRRNGLEQMFLDVTDYNGANLADRRDSTAVSDTLSSIDHLAVRTLSVNAYYDFLPGSWLSPYLGAGAGPAFVTVAGVRFTDEYRDTAANGEVYDPPLSYYNARLDEDLSDTVLAGHVYAGADFRVTRRTWLGLKLTYSMLADIETSGGYDLHPVQAVDPDFTHHNTFTGARSWTLMLTAKYVFRN